MTTIRKDDIVKVGTHGQGVVARRERQPGPGSVQPLGGSILFADQRAVGPQLNQNHLAASGYSLGLDDDSSTRGYLVAVLRCENGDGRPGRVPPSDDQGRQEAVVGGSRPGNRGRRAGTRPRSGQPAAKSRSVYSFGVSFFHLLVSGP